MKNSALPPTYNDIYPGQSEQDETEEPVPAAIVFLNIINALTQFFLGATVLGAIVIANNDQEGDQTAYSQHIILCVIGYALLMGQAVLMLGPQSGWAHGLRGPVRRGLHGGMQAVGGILGISGCIVKIADYGRTHHEAVPHAVIGYIVMALTLLILIGGVLNCIDPEKMQTLSYSRVQAYVNIFTLAMAFICICTGVESPVLPYDYATGPLIIVSCIMALIGVLIMSFFTIMT